jgi:hypothetical protein
VGLNCTLYAEHRIIWKMMTGDDPSDTVDHKNNDPRDNRWSNLRIANETQQKWNRGLQSNNKSGYRGVSLHMNGRYQARINDGRTYKHLGLFDTPKEASEAYQAAARMLHGEFHHTPR